MGNGMLKQDDWRIFQHKVSYKQFLRDVHLANAICGHSFTDPRTGARLRFDPVTNVDHHELLPVLWRLEGKLLVIARTEQPAPVAAAVGEEEEKEEKGSEPTLPSSEVGHALSIDQFYHLFIYLTDNLPLVQHARKQLQQLTLPPASFSSAPSSSSSSSSSTPDPPTADEDDSRVCSICVTNSVDVALPCLHAFCRQCIEDWNGRDATCPLCRRKADAATDEDVWVMNGGSEADLREQLNTVCRFPFVYLEDKPEYGT